MSNKFEPQHFVELIKAKVEEEHGSDVLRLAMRDGIIQDAHERAQDLIKRNGEGSLDIADESDVDYYADEFIANNVGRFRRLLTRIEDGSSTEMTVLQSARYGSLRNVIAYASAIPRAIRAREEIVGQKEPLTYREAVVWLREREEEGMSIEWNVITLWLRHPDASRDPVSRWMELDIPYGGSEDEVVEWFRKNIRLHNETSRQVDLDPELQSEGETRRCWVHLRTEPTSIGLHHGRLVALAEEARALIHFTRLFDRAVWLILTGVWEKAGAFEEMVSGWESDRDDGIRRNLVHGLSLPWPIRIEICEPELSGDDLKEYYIQIKQDRGLMSKTRHLSYETEVLSMIALEAINLYGVGAGDPGFYKRVLERFKQQAENYGLDPASAFPSYESVRKALERVQRAYIAQRKEVIGSSLRHRTVDKFRVPSLFKIGHSYVVDNPEFQAQG